jgi:endonuclease/exonuclease/phosphatase family metal-dependent hydrolase
MGAPRPNLRLATYNVHGCVGVDGRHDPARVARVINELDVDLVALQEFSYPADVAIETRTPVVLTTLDRYQCALGPTREHEQGHYGNVLLSRHPIRELRRVDLSFRRREPRGALVATIDAGGIDLHVLATHLGLKLGERRVQVTRILEQVDALSSELFVVLGDFNDWLPGRSIAHALDERLGRAVRLRTFPSRAPLLSLDRIWVHPRAALASVAVHASALARRASDHLPVVAELKSFATNSTPPRETAPAQADRDRATT